MGRNEEVYKCLLSFMKAEKQGAKSLCKCSVSFKNDIVVRSSHCDGDFTAAVHEFEPSHRWF